MCAKSRGTCVLDRHNAGRRLDVVSLSFSTDVIFVRGRAGCVPTARVRSRGSNSLSCRRCRERSCVCQRPYSLRRSIHSVSLVGRLRVSTPRMVPVASEFALDRDGLDVGVVRETAMEGDEYLTEF